MPYPRQNQRAKFVGLQFAGEENEHTNITGDYSTNGLGTAKVTHIDFYGNIQKDHKLQHLYSKMTKKQLKLAQSQLDKLTQINIHLHGT